MATNSWRVSELVRKHSSIRLVTESVSGTIISSYPSVSSKVFRRIGAASSLWAEKCSSKARATRAGVSIKPSRSGSPPIYRRIVREASSTSARSGAAVSTRKAVTFAIRGRAFHIRSLECVT